MKRNWNNAEEKKENFEQQDDNKELSNNERLKQRRLERHGRVVNAKKVNIRRSAEVLPDNILFVANEGQTFKIVGREKRYYRIEFEPGKFGYILYDYFKEV